METKDQDWTPNQIREAIHAKGISMESLSIGAGLSSSVVRMALRRRSPNGERLIAELLGVPAHQIWPSRYRPDGVARSRPAVRASITAQRRIANSQKRGAA
jgi:Ner family transcriptional regulator